MVNKRKKTTMAAKKKPEVDKPNKRPRTTASIRAKVTGSATNEPEGQRAQVEDESEEEDEEEEEAEEVTVIETSGETATEQLGMHTLFI